MPIFPTVQGENVLGRRFVLPRDLEGKFNIILIGLQQSHQTLTDSWIVPLETLTRSLPKVSVYVLAVMPPLNLLVRTVIDTAMRQTISPQKMRERTLKLYIDREPFLRRLEIVNTETVIPMVVLPDGQIIWRGKGGYDKIQFASLKLILTETNPTLQNHQQAE